MEEQLYKDGIGTISEIYDGDAPWKARGCIAQAWSVVEILRAYIEDFNSIHKPPVLFRFRSMSRDQPVTVEPFQFSSR